MPQSAIKVNLTKDQRTAYVQLPGYKLESGSVKKTVHISELIDGYKGPYVNFDFDADGVMTGIEILIFGED